MAQVPSVTDILLLQLDQAFDGKAWHGPTLRGSLRGLTPELATRSSSGGHSIADIALHCAYWKYVARRRLLRLPRGSFPWKGSNWFKLPNPLGAETWRGILRLLDQEHAQLRRAVAEFPVKKLLEVPPSAKVNQATLLVGIANHDVYHAGQVRVLKRMVK